MWIQDEILVGFAVNGLKNTESLIYRELISGRVPVFLNAVIGNWRRRNLIWHRFERHGYILQRNQQE